MLTRVVVYRLVWQLRLRSRPVKCANSARTVQRRFVPPVLLDRCILTSFVPSGSGDKETQGCRATKEGKVVACTRISAVIYRSYSSLALPLSKSLLHEWRRVYRIYHRICPHEYDMHLMHYFPGNHVKFDGELAVWVQVYIVHAITTTRLWVSKKGCHLHWY